MQRYNNSSKKPSNISYFCGFLYQKDIFHDKITPKCNILFRNITKMSLQISSKNTVICLTVVDTSSTMLSMRKLKHGK